MLVGALAADAGIVLGHRHGVVPPQAYFYEVNGIDGAAVPWRLPGCRMADLLIYVFVYLRSDKRRDSSRRIVGEARSA